MRRWIAPALGFAALGSMLVSGAAAAPALQLPAYKDDLFGYSPMTAVLDGGAYLDVEYSEARDIDRRDDVPERRVKRAYVDLSAARGQQDFREETPAGPVGVMTAGNSSDPTAIVLFVHGRNGDRRLGMNDWTFGGNFNRLKNLLARAGALYVTVDGGKLGEDDASRVAGVLEHLRAAHPGAPMVLLCGSMGGELCWNLAARPATASVLDGLVFLGSNSGIDRFRALQSAAGRDVPILLAQGSRDKVYPLADQKAFFEAVRTTQPGYPIRFVAFDGGNHGTPVRMIDWRDTLNWIFSR